MHMIISQDTHTHIYIYMYIYISLNIYIWPQDPQISTPASEGPQFPLRPQKMEMETKHTLPEKGIT